MNTMTSHSCPAVALALLALCQPVLGDTDGVNVTSLTWNASPNPIACGSSGEVTATVTLELRSTMPDNVGIAADLWDDDPSLSFLLLNPWWPDDRIGTSQMINVSKPPNTPTSITRTLTIPVECRGCTLFGNNATSGEPDPTLYIQIIDGDLDGINDGKSAGAVVSCVSFTLAMFDESLKILALAASRGEDTSKAERLLAMLASTKDPEQAGRVARRLSGAIAAIEMSETSRRTIERSSASYVGSLKRKSE
ncbi:MAG: hypothetical protein PVF91_12775 [Chromatiales bacterium]|jgi:hypothetical protein